MLATSASSICMLLILMVKKGLKKHISARWQYRLDLLFFVLLIIPLIPSGFFASLNMGSRIATLLPEREAATSTTAATGEGIQFANGMGRLQDFAVAIDRSAPEYLSAALIGIWIAGIITFAVIMLFCYQKLRIVKESMKLTDDEEMLSLFSRCKSEIGVKGNISLGSSVLVKTPMAMGFFKTLVIMPAGKILLSDARYAMLHELAHCNNKDIQINTVMYLFQILYWFNPIVYLAFNQMRMDRELACDAYVLETLPERLHADYGETLLNFVNTLPRPSALFFTAAMGGRKPQIIKRVEHIASYTTESSMLRAKSICVFVLMGLLVFCQIPILSVLANNDNERFHFQADNVLYKDMSSFFDGLDGSFVLYDLNTGLYTIHNRDMSMARVSPNSTYKIFSALIALETGAVEASGTLREWDGTVHLFEAWNRDHNLASAMQYSVNWYFQYLDARVGMEGLRSYLTRLPYGNRNISGGIADFWIESSLRISPLEQVKLLRNFHQNNTIFETEHINTLKDVLRLSERDGAVLSGKTGTGSVTGRGMNGWFIGYVENNGHTFIFATYIQGEDNARGSAAVQITLSILEDKGIY